MAKSYSIVLSHTVLVTLDDLQNSLSVVFGGRISSVAVKPVVMDYFTVSTFYYGC